MKQLGVGGVVPNQAMDRWAVVAQWSSPIINVAAIIECITHQLR